MRMTRTTMHAGPLGTIDLSDGQTFRQGFPHALFDELRRTEPVAWHPATAMTPDGEGFWVVSSYEHVKYVFNDPTTYSSDRGGVREQGGTGLKDEASAGRMLNQTDDPQHRRLRSLVSRGFTPTATAELENNLSRLCADLFDVAESQDFDFVASVARELPSQAICMILAIPESERKPLLNIMDEGIHAASDSIIALEAMKEMRRFARRFVEDKRLHPDVSMTSTIINASLDDGSQLSDKEIWSFIELLFLAGSETTRSALAGAVHQFALHPEEFDRLAVDSDLMGPAVEEVVRITTPSIYKRRTASRDAELGGKSIRRGDKVTVWEMSANRDEIVFDEPHRFDVARWPNPHVGFGFGAHYCLGASLARLEIRVALNWMLEHYSGCQLMGEPEWMPNSRLLGLRTLPVRFQPK